MDEGASSSMNSNIMMNMTAKTSGSFSSFYTIRASKRPRHDANVVTIVANKFKGVLPQQNGHWGAQIYANHQRIWLGTFKSEKEAAMAYDSAAIKLRSGDTHRNFPWTDRNIQEPNFQSQYSTEAILSMIRDGSYQPKFADFLRTLGGEMGASLNQRGAHGEGKFSCMQLFQKELTPSDVGKLNRLVIPKKFAVKYFPYICENGDQDDGVYDLELVFFDRLMKCWKFRYSYWRSSQSFVFTRGWNRFVKEKNLKEKDVVTFYTCVCPHDIQEGQHFSLIDITYSNNGQSCVVDGISQMEEMQKELELNVGRSIRNQLDSVQDDQTKLRDEEEEEEEEEVLNKLSTRNNVKEKGLKLFGVRIN